MPPTKRRKPRVIRNTRKWKGGGSNTIEFITEDEKQSVIDLVTEVVPPQESEKIKAIFNLVLVGYDRTATPSKLIFGATDQQPVQSQVQSTQPTSSNQTMDDIQKYENKLLSGNENSSTKDGNGYNYISRLRGDLAYRMYSYLHYALLNLRDKIGNPSTPEPKRKKYRTHMRFVRSIIRHIEILRKPLWVTSLMDLVDKLFSEASKLKPSDEYLDEIDTSKKGVRVWMDVNVDYSNANSINNEQCEDSVKRDYVYSLRTKPLAPVNTHKRVNHMINSILYEKEIINTKPNQLYRVATYKNDMVHNDAQPTTTTT